MSDSERAEGLIANTALGIFSKIHYGFARIFSKIHYGRARGRAGFAIIEYEYEYC
ncbi:MAG: hypothetical protein ACK5OB_19220 [Pirellula sp.]